MVISSPHWWQPEPRKLSPFPGLRFAVVEVATWLAGYSASLFAGVLALGGTERAVRNTDAVIGLERTLGLFHEPRLQELSRSLPGLSTLAGAYYVVLFGPVTAAVLVWMARRHRSAYRRLRARMLFALALALPFFLILPAVPPRLVPGLAVADTVGLGAHGGASFLGIRFNPYAAVPSMHVCWAFLLALGWRGVVTTSWARRLIAAHPVLMTLTVMTTGNHLLTDAALGIAVALVASTVTTIAPGASESVEPRGGWNRVQLGLRLRHRRRRRPLR